ncbi:hypothetical protein [Streptomyces sp. MAR4 CNX-425]|uniref:hypothetical protein n=1 Tax=Streptomyces sp. MAR4 CNX-425 TaxID=3406343 RepID=UPI003B502031
MALAEIELCGELIIAATSAPEERLSDDRIDEVLRVEAARRGSECERGRRRGRQEITP